MPVDNESDTGTRYTVGRPRPNGPTPAEMVAAGATVVAIGAQVYLLTQGGESTVLIVALVSSIIALGVLVVTIVQGGNTEQLEYDVVLTHELKRKVPGEPAPSGPLPPEIAADWIIHFHHAQTDEFLVGAGQVPGASSTVTLHRDEQRLSNGNSGFYCTLN